MTRLVTVFGSNINGIHGAGAALDAFNAGFPQGLGVGYHRASGWYALPTRRVNVHGTYRVFVTLPLWIIELYAGQLAEFANHRPDLEFKVTRVGCGHAGYRDEEIAPMFAATPIWCSFDEAWKPWLGQKYRYWGTFA